MASNRRVRPRSALGGRRIEARRAKPRKRMLPRAATRVVPSDPRGNGAGRRFAPRSSSARAVSPRKGWANRNAVFGPTGISACARRMGKNRTGAIPSASNSRANWSSTMSASAPTTMRLGLAFASSSRQRGDKRGETGVLALREGRLDPAARIGDDPNAWGALLRLSSCRAFQIDLDDLRGA